MTEQSMRAAARIYRSSSRGERDEIAAAAFASITGDADPPVDRELVRLAREDPGTAFEILYGSYRGRIFTFLLRVCGSSEVADDLAQDTFIKAHRAIGGLAEDSKLLPWLYRIANNTAIDHLRRRKRFAWLPWSALHDTDEEPADAAAHDRIPEQSAIAHVLGMLPPENAAALLLHAIEGYSYEEIARIQGCSLAAVRSRIARARSGFKERWPA